MGHMFEYNLKYNLFTSFFCQLYFLVRSFYDFLHLKSALLCYTLQVLCYSWENITVRH